MRSLDCARAICQVRSLDVFAQSINLGTTFYQNGKHVEKVGTILRTIPGSVLQTALVFLWFVWANTESPIKIELLVQKCVCQSANLVVSRVRGPATPSINITVRKGKKRLASLPLVAGNQKTCSQATTATCRQTKCCAAFSKNLTMANLSNIATANLRCFCSFQCVEREEGGEWDSNHHIWLVHGESLVTCCVLFQVSGNKG